MSNAKVAIAYAAKLYRDAITGRLNADTSDTTQLLNESLAKAFEAYNTGRLNADTSDTTQLLNESFAKAFEAYRSDRGGWVGLTDEERLACTESPFTDENYRAIEAKLKEKNQ